MIFHIPSSSIILFSYISSLTALSRGRELSLTSELIQYFSLTIVFILQIWYLLKDIELTFLWPMLWALHPRLVDLDPLPHRDLMEPILFTPLHLLNYCWSFWRSSWSSDSNKVFSPSIAGSSYSSTCLLYLLEKERSILPSTTHRGLSHV